MFFKYFFKISLKVWMKNKYVEWHIYIYIWNEMEFFGTKLNHLELKWMKRNVQQERPKKIRNVPLSFEKNVPFHLVTQPTAGIQKSQTVVCQPTPRVHWENTV